MRGEPRSGLNQTLIALARFLSPAGKGAPNCTDDMQGLCSDFVLPS